MGWEGNLFVSMVTHGWLYWLVQFQGIWLMAQWVQWLSGNQEVASSIPSSTRSGWQCAGSRLHQCVNVRWPYKELWIKAPDKCFNYDSIPHEGMKINSPPHLSVCMITCSWLALCATCYVPASSLNCKHIENQLKPSSVCYHWWMSWTAVNPPSPPSPSLPVPGWSASHYGRSIRHQSRETTPAGTCRERGCWCALTSGLPTWLKSSSLIYHCYINVCRSIRVYLMLLKVKYKFIYK